MLTNQEPLAKKIKVHVYKIFSTTSAHTEFSFNEKDIAIQFAEREFQRKNVYKVKVWDLSKGEIERNNPNAAALILELN